MTQQPQPNPNPTRPANVPTSPPAPMTPGEKLIRSYLIRSAGTANQPTDHTIRCFLGMVETGEATWHDVRAAGGEWLVGQVVDMRKKVEAGE